MQEDTDELGIIQVLVTRLEKQRLPVALQLLDKVNRGEQLNDMDIEFLETVFADTGKIKPMLDNNPEWQPLAARMMSLYNEITTRALQNEQEAGKED